MKIKDLWKFYPLLVIIGIFSYFHIKGENNRTKFYESKLNEKIIDSSDWQKRTTEYYLENGLRINVTVLDSIHLEVGDSISKQSQSKEYSIYRKNRFGKYEFYKNYSID